jgi:hypothetical protein
MAQLYTNAAALVQLGYADTTFRNDLSKEELNSDMRITEVEQNPKLAEAIARTNSRLPQSARIPVPGGADGVH